MCVLPDESKRTKVSGVLRKSLGFVADSGKHNLWARYESRADKAPIGAHSEQFGRDPIMNNHHRSPFGAVKTGYEVKKTGYRVERVRCPGCPGRQSFWQRLLDWLFNR